MPDEFDTIAERLLEEDALIHKIRYEIPKGFAGVCVQCEEPSPRLIGNRCAPCRDGRDRGAPKRVPFGTGDLC